MTDVKDCLLHCAVTLCRAMQHLISTASRPHPGLAVGASVNTVVFTAGLQVLLKGTSPLAGSAPLSKLAPS